MCIICTGSHLSEKLQTSLKKEWCLHFNCSSLLWLLLQSFYWNSSQSGRYWPLLFSRHLFSVFMQLDLSLGFDITNCFNPSWNPLLLSLWSTIFLMFLLLLQVLFFSLIVLWFTSFCLALYIILGDLICSHCFNYHACCWLSTYVASPDFSLSFIH